MSQVLERIKWIEEDEPLDKFGEYVYVQKEDEPFEGSKEKKIRN